MPAKMRSVEFIEKFFEGFGRSGERRRRGLGNRGLPRSARRAKIAAGGNPVLLADGVEVFFTLKFEPMFATFKREAFSGEVLVERFTRRSGLSGLGSRLV